MSRNGRRWVHAAATLTLVLLIILFARHVDWRAAAAAARGADAGLLVVALVCNQLSLVLKGVRWWVFLRPLGVRSLSLVLRATYAGASLNNLVVAQGGEAARVLIVARASGVATSRVTSALALERVLDGVSYLVLLSGASFFLILPATLMRWRAATLGALVLVLLGLAVLGTTARPQRGEADGMHSVRSVRTRLAQFAASIAGIASPARLGQAMLLSLGAWSLQVATYHTVALAAHLEIPLSASVAAMLTIGISFLVRGTPGNVGIFQVIYAVTMAKFGVGQPAAVATALLLQAVQIVPTVAIGTCMAYGFTTPAGRTAGKPPPLGE